MTKKIFKSVLLIAVIMVLFCCTFILGILYRHFTNIEEQQLESQLGFVVTGVQNQGEDYLKNLEEKKYRITWIEADGTVKFDNKSDVSKMENHADREEVKDALKFGRGECSRYSVTLMQKTLYYAKKISDGSVVRISVSQDTVLKLLFSMISPIVITIVLAIKKFNKGFLSQVAILIAVVIGYVISLALGQVSTTEIQNASLIAIPSFTLPKFDMGAIAIIAPVILAVFMEHVGDITTNGEVVGKNFIEDPGLNRTLLGDGVATLVAGLIGGPANTTYGENTGVLAITKNYDPSILRITAVFAILLSFIAKFGAVIRTIPQPVMGGISLILFSMIAIVGFKTIKREKVEFNIFNIIVMASILIVGLSGNFLPNAISIQITETVSISGLSLAAIVGVVLNIILTKLSKVKNK